MTTQTLTNVEKVKQAFAAFGVEAAKIRPDFSAWVLRDECDSHLRMQQRIREQRRPGLAARRIR